MMFGRGGRANLQRRLFAWFVGAILVTGGVFSLTQALLETSQGTPWKRRLENAGSFVGRRFESVWDSPSERARLAAELAESFSVHVRALGPDEADLGRWGPDGGRRLIDIPVLRGDATLGHVEVHMPARTGGLPRGPLILVLTGLVMWAAAGWAARRIARPFHALAATAKALGEGALDARVPPMRHAYQEAQALGQTLNEMAERVQRQLRDQRELLAAVSHEMRTPLARLRILAELLRTKGGDAALVAEVERETVEMDALVGQLLANARVDFGTLQRTSCVAQEVAGRELTRQQLPLSLLHAPDEPIGVSADPTLLSRALANLIDNAQRHGAGLKALRVVREDGGVSFAVEDEGPGFPSTSGEGVFHPFASPAAPSSAHVAPGLRLGLSLVQRIAQAHGGRAFAKNRPPQGAVVGMWLPA
ncbi:MAG: ATP-binding protein [Myxococcaceae bacterium]